MKKMGLVGGTGPESTLMYYKELNARMDERTGGKAMPDLMIDSINFRRAWDYVLEENYPLLADYLSEKVKALKAGGAKIISLTAVTMHVVLEEIEKKTNVKLISIPQAVCEYALKMGYHKIALLGTMLTMEKDYMKKDFLDAGIKIVVPDKEGKDLVAKRIFEELEFGIVKDSTLQEFNTLLTKMKEEQQVEAVILGCTELPLLLNDENCVLPCLDSVKIHIEKLLDQAMKE